MNFSGPGYDVTINMPSREALFRALRARFAAHEGFALATLNLDHLTKLPSDPQFAAAYSAHDLIVADGRPVVWLSQLARSPVALMPGSDMIVPLCEIAAQSGAPIALMGSNDAALTAAADALRARVPGLDCALCHAPPYGFDPAGPQADAICDMLNASGPRLCFIALGAPKQELFAAHARNRCPAIGFASIGAGLDFLAGSQTRAPAWMRALALEWLWRALQSPRRMVPRYAKCFAILPGLTLRAWLARKTPR
ncbi:MAG: WecB/TagA/CpsF family glycosyltransferase [Sulfitobacter sp.]